MNNIAALEKCCRVSLQYINTHTHTHTHIYILYTVKSNKILCENTHTHTQTHIYSSQHLRIKKVNQSCPKTRTGIS